MSNGQFNKRFGLNLAQLETLCCEIVAQSGLEIEPPFKKGPVSTVRHGGFDSIFESTTAINVESAESKFDLAIN